MKVLEILKSFPWVKWLVASTLAAVLMGLLSKGETWVDYVAAYIIGLFVVATYKFIIKPSVQK